MNLRDFWAAYFDYRMNPTQDNADGVIAELENLTTPIEDRELEEFIAQLDLFVKLQSLNKALEDLRYSYNFLSSFQ